MSPRMGLVAAFSCLDQAHEGGIFYLRLVVHQGRVGGVL